VRRAWILAADGVVLVGVLALVALAPLARFAADAQPQHPADIIRLMPLPPHPHGGSLRDLPAGLPQGLTVKTPADLAALLDRALGRTGGQALLALLGSGIPDVIEGQEMPNPSPATNPVYPVYPYHYPALDWILDGAPASGWRANATALGAALIELASRPGGDGYGSARFVNAAPAAFAVLDRARASGGCAPQLDLVLLVASDASTEDKVVRTEAARAVAHCPGDLTPGWVLGQYLSQQPPPPGARSGNGEAVFSELVKAYPASVAAVTGAADAHLRTGMWLADSQPFTARNEFRAAEQGYERATALGAGKDSSAGLAAALTGLGEPAQAERILRHLIVGSRTPGPLLELLIVAEEKAHDFASAESDARHLTQLKEGAYPDGPALFPAPRVPSLAVDRGLPVPAGLTAPLSLGVDRFAPFTAALAGGFGGGGSVEDVSFIPAYRSVDSVTGSNPSCADWEWRRDAVLAGHAGDALREFPASSGAVARNRLCVDAYYAEPDGAFYALVQAEAGINVPMARAAADRLAADRQNLWRWAGDMPKAEAVIRAWAAASPGNPTPDLRLGEVEYLQRQYEAAAADFGKAARLTLSADYRNNLGVDEALLDRGASLLAAGRAAEATAILRDVERDAAGGVAYYRNGDHPDVLARFAAVAYYARAQLADHERQSHALRAAAEDYAAALEMLPLLSETTGPRLEALYNNSAIADLGLRRLGSARTAVGKALGIDPANPAFLMTAGYVADQSGQTQAAIQYDSAALESDGGAYPAANDLGVELARQHRDAAAASALRKAVGARPDYALGWFNLGVLYAQMGPAHLLASQGALGKAFALDPDLRGRERRLTIDANVYRTGLDLSKPLPPNWSFAQAQRGSPAGAVGLFAAALLALGLARARGSAAKDVADRWLEPVTRALDRVPVIRRLRPPAWAVAATVAAFLLPLAHQPVNGAIAVLAFGISVLVLALAAIRARVVVARAAGLTTQQESWRPGILFGVVMGAAGMPWAPLPVLRAPDESRRAHLAAPIALSLLGALLFIESAWLKVPLSESLGTASLIMAASTLLPVSPLDGAKVGSGGLVAGAGVLAAAILLGLGVV